MVYEAERFFNPLDYVREKTHNLTFLDQQGKYQFVTFHCADSLPSDKCKELIELLGKFMLRYPKPWSLETYHLYRQLIGKRQEELLDKGYGRCLLRNPEIRNILEEAMLYHNHKRYELVSYVIMPNHVHILMYSLEDFELENSLHSIKNFSAKRINKLTGDKGNFWVEDNYCRLIRNERHFENTRIYISENPRFLKEGEFSLRFF